MRAVYGGEVERRRFLRTLVAAAPMLVIPSVGKAVPSDFRALGLTHLHTGEHLAVEYMRRGVYVPDALASINQLLRDFRTGDVYPIDPALLDLLHALTVATGSRRPFEVISGYRSPTTNEHLRGRSGGVASGSLHMKGQAIDIRVADVRLAALRDAARVLRRGGVGYYPTSNFVHVDTGRVRAW